MKPYQHRTCLVAVACAFVLAAPRHTRAGAPTDQLRQHVDEVLRILQQPDRGSPAEREAIRKAAGEVFDFEETAKRSLGPHWQSRTPAQRDEFTKLFADLLEQGYIPRIEQYSGEKIAYTAESVEGDQATVHTKIVTKKETDVSNYRTQFNQIIRTGRPS